MSIIMMAKGAAATMDAVCKPCNPPLYSSTAAIVDCNKPHINFTLVVGFGMPLEDNMPNTNVAESADVIKNVIISKVAIAESTAPIGSF